MKIESDITPRGRGKLIRNLGDFQTELFRAIGGYLPGIPHWEAQRRLAEFIFRDARRVQELRTRVRELGAGFNEMHFSRNVAGRKLIEALCEAPSSADFIHATFTRVKKTLIGVIENYAENALGIYDLPSQSILAANLEELKTQVAWAEKIPAELEDGSIDPSWQSGLDDLLENLPSELEKTDVKGGEILQKQRRMGRLPFAKASIPPGFHFLPAGLPPLSPEAEYPERARWHASNFLLEIQATQSCASLLFETPDMPWEFFFDCARHMWDESRHCEFGEVKLRSLNVDYKKVGISSLAYDLRQTLSPLDRYAALTTQEADAFPGKHAGLKDAIAHSDTVSSTAWSYDIADETQHVRYGHKWIPVMIEKTGEPRSYDQIKADAENWRAFVLAQQYDTYADKRGEVDAQKILSSKA